MPESSLTYLGLPAYYERQGENDEWMRVPIPEWAIPRILHARQQHTIERRMWGSVTSILWPVAAERVVGNDTPDQ